MQAENDLRAQLEKASKAAAAAAAAPASSSDTQAGSDRRGLMAAPVVTTRQMQRPPAYSTAVVRDANDVVTRAHSSIIMGPPLAREESSTARLTTADLSTPPFSQPWKVAHHHNHHPLHFSGSHISAASSFAGSTTTTAPKAFATTRPAWQPKVTPSAPQSVAGAGVSTTNAMEAFRKAASSNHPTYSTNLAAKPSTSSASQADFAASGRTAAQVQRNPMAASTSRLSPASKLLPPDAAGSFEEKLALIRAQRQQLQAQVERGVLLQPAH